MCTVFVIRRVLPDWPLVVAANRDEALGRPWRAPEVFNDGRAVAMATDLEAGGTWVGVNDCGLVVTITNRMALAGHLGRRSRGLLCRDLLAAGDLKAAEEQCGMALARDTYAPFNLVLATLERTVVLSQALGEMERTVLGDGVHVIDSSHDLDGPSLDHHRETLAHDPAGFEANLAAVLSDHTILEGRYSVCKHWDGYGTKSASDIRIAPSGQIRFGFASGPPCQTAFEEAPVP